MSKDLEVKKRGGRPKSVDLDPKMMDRVEAALRIGCPVATAFALSGVPYSLLRRWVVLAHKDPKSPWADIMRRVEKAVSEWELRDLSVIEAHAHGRPAQYQMEPVIGPDGNVVYESPGKPLMTVSKDGNGNPILIREEIKSDWRAAMERLKRRKPAVWDKVAQWNLREIKDVEGVIRVDAEDLKDERPENQESFQAQVARAMKEFDDEF